MTHRRIRRITKFTLFAVCTLWAALASCSRHDNDFSGFHNIPAEGWGYYRHLIFTHVPADSIVTGNVDLVVRHNNDYPFSNLYVEVTYDQPGRHTVCDTVSVELADIYGNWYGNGPGTSFQRKVRLAEGLTVHDSLHIRLRHVMRIDPVPDIEQIGIIFTASNQK